MLKEETAREFLARDFRTMASRDIENDQLQEPRAVLDTLIEPTSPTN